MNKIGFLNFIFCLMAVLLSALSPRAEEIIISDISVTTIESPDSLHQCALILDFNIPDRLDSVDVSFAELTGRISYELNSGFPMTLGSVPIPQGQELQGRSFEEIKERLSEIFDLSQLSTASFGESSSDTASFDISSMFENWLSDPATFNGILIIQLNSISSFLGLNPDDPRLEIKIDYVEQGIE